MFFDVLGQSLFKKILNYKYIIIITILLLANIQNIFTSYRKGMNSHD